MPRYFLKHGVKTVAIFYDRDMALTAAAMFVCDFIEETPKVATVQLPSPIHPIIPSEPDGVAEHRTIDSSRARATTRKLAIHVSYTVKHSVRYYIARHQTQGTITGTTFDHDQEAHWFFRQIRKTWPTHVISKA